MTDISTIVAAERAIDIKHPATGLPIGLRITLLPDSHPKVRAESRRMTNERMASRGKTTADEIESARLGLLSASVGNWEWQGDLNFQGQKPEASPVAVRGVMEALPWIADQVDRELANQASFFRIPEETAG